VVPAELPELLGPRVRLRRPLDSDVDALMRLPIDADVVRMYGAVHVGPLVRSRREAKRRVAQMRAEPMLWVIDVNGYAGSIRLHRLNTIDRRISLAVGLDDVGRLGQGLGTEAIKLVLGHAFGTMNLHRVSLRVAAYNARAIRAYEKCGFVTEGVEREALCLDGVWHDDVMMGLLAQHFRPDPRLSRNLP
jgi:RimJ/RimL family protein N-acetyltransferase